MRPQKRFFLLVGFGVFLFPLGAQGPKVLETLGREKEAAFYRDFEGVLAADRGRDLLLLADKQHSLPNPYVPADLVTLTGNNAYAVSRGGMRLRQIAETALRRMGEAAQKDGVTLVVSSAYRSYEYQVGVYNGHAKRLGTAAADRISSRPGKSQHQLGTAVDFGSIDDTFAQTPASRWLLQNAGTFGWSLSFPEGYEKQTGYQWESWHWRYVGVEACAFQKKWFGNIQQFMLEFIHDPPPQGTAKN